jgi:hypothetical protein
MQRLGEIANVVPLISKADSLPPDEISALKRTVNAIPTALSKLPVFDPTPSPDSRTTMAPYTVSSASGPDRETIDASLLMSPEYVQPLIPSELAVLMEQIFETEVMTYLRHTAAKKLISWHASHPKWTSTPSTSAVSAPQSTLPSPLTASLSNSGLLVPIGSDISLTTSNSYALARLADHAQREERLAQIRLSKWASDLQISLQRERERYEQLARDQRAIWLIERMGEEIRDGQVLPADKSHALVKGGQISTLPGGFAYSTHDPLGLLRLQDSMNTRGWIALQLVGSFGVIGGLAFWLAKTWGFTNSLHDWASQWWCGMNE